MGRQANWNTEVLRKRLKQALHHVDSFPPIPSDDEALFMDINNVLHELPHEQGQLSLGDLRDILTILEAL